MYLRNRWTVYSVQVFYWKQGVKLQNFETTHIKKISGKSIVLDAVYQLIVLKIFIDQLPKTVFGTIQRPFRLELPVFLVGDWKYTTHT